eukprot:GHVL01003953.1.p1 GENE.GHVL01003953.1~~GHVL01003953.1.p1  ORF type:complete len:749 (+),score=147.86 GHVL01003953.1:60-2306(+)
MTQKIQKPWKLQELHAHTAPVRCATLGGRSGQVMATGGDDKKINVWRVGRPNALMSLGGNASSVDCVCFDSAEETLLAGFQGGGMKVYNLEAQKSRVIEGHRTRVLCCDFHPYGDFIASGSQDTNLKIWDLRRKSCIQTYKGHKDAVTVVRFSPHGRWIMSGGADHQLRLWDLTAGKPLWDFNVHQGTINCIDFHPHEFLAASSGTDQLVKFLDLEHFEPLGSSDFESSPVTALRFTPGGHHLVTASQEFIKVVTVEPYEVVTCIPSEWSAPISDIRLSTQQEGRAYCLSTHDTFVDTTYSKNSDSTRTSSTNQTIHHQLSSARILKTPPDVKSTSENSSSDPYRDNEFQYDAFYADDPPPPRILHKQNDVVGNFKSLPQRTSSASGSYNHESTKTTKLQSSATEEFRKDPEQPRADFHAPRTEQHAPRTEQHAPRTEQHAPRTEQHAPRTEQQSSRSEHQSSRWESSKSDQRSRGGEVSRRQEETRPIRTISPRSVTSEGPDKRPNSSCRSRTPPASSGSRYCHEDQSNNARSRRGASRPEGGAASRSRTPPLSYRGRDAVSKPVTSEADVAKTLLERHKNIMSTLTKRLSNVRAARSYWTSGSCKGLLLHIEKVNDLAVTCDCIKGIIRSRDDPFTLEECSLLLPILREVVKSDQQEFIIVGLQATQRMIRHFGDIIRRTREYARIHQSAPVDISREERLERCNRCYETVFEIGDILDEKLRNRSSKTCVFSSARDEIRRFCDDCE